MTKQSRWFLLFSLLFVPLASGCAPKKATTGRDTGVAPSSDSEAAALSALDGHPDLESIRTALQRLDALESSSTRPAWSETDRIELA